MRGEGLPRGRTAWAHLAVAALLGNALPYVLFAFAQTDLPSSAAGIINATTPLWAIAFEIAVTRRGVPSLRLVGLLVGFAGTVLLFAPWRGSTTVPVGAGLAALVAAASYGLAYVYQHRYLTGRSWSPAALSAGQLTLATGQVAVLVPVAGTQAIHLRWDAMAGLIALGLVSTGFGYVLNYRLIADEGPAASVVSYLIPVVAVILGWAALGEHLTVPIFTGILVVLAGIGLTQLRS